MLPGAEQVVRQQRQKLERSGDPRAVHFRSDAACQGHEPFRGRASRRKCRWRTFTRVAQSDGTTKKLKSKSAMNIVSSTSLRTAALAAALVLSSAIAPAKDAAPADSTAQLLSTAGSVPVKAAGPYVQVGSYRIHVWARLGHPSAVTSDGTWFYRNFKAEESAANGTLVVRFDRGQVSSL